MICLREMDPRSADDAEEYLALLARSSQNPEVTTLLPEILEETRIDDVRKALTIATRYFVVVDGLVAGRVELSDHLNADPSVVDKFPEDVSLGLNTCYFFNPDGVSRNENDAHRIVAAKSIRVAFEKQNDLSSVPWLPVAPEGDPSRGWLMQEISSGGYPVHVGVPHSGWFPQFDIDSELFSPVYATTPKSA